MLSVVYVPGAPLMYVAPFERLEFFAYFSIRYFFSTYYEFLCYALNKTAGLKHK